MQTTLFPSSTQASPLQSLVTKAMVTRGDEFLRGIVISSRRSQGSFKEHTNRALMAGLRPNWKDNQFDTFCDHLFDVLKEKGILTGEAPWEFLRSSTLSFPDLWKIVAPRLRVRRQASMVSTIGRRHSLIIGFALGSKIRAHIPFQKVSRAVSERKQIVEQALYRTVSTYRTPMPELDSVSHCA